MSKFRNVYKEDYHIKVESPVGSRFYVKRAWRYNDIGEHVYEPVETINVYEKIQASRDSVDLQALLKRYEAGDNTALDQVQKTYFDMVSMPKNYAELFKAANTAQEVFNGLPTQIKEEFNNNAALFWSASGTSQFDDAINSYRADVFAVNYMVDENPVRTVDVTSTVESEVLSNEKSE